MEKIDFPIVFYTSTAEIYTPDRITAPTMEGGTNMATTSNKRSNVNLLVLWSLLFMLVGMPAIGTAVEGLVVKLTSKEGTEVSVPDANFNLDDFLLTLSTTSFTPRYQSLQVIGMEVGKGVLMAIPVGIFQEAELKGETHIITLTTGEKLHGKLAGYVTSGKSEKKHLLSSARKVTLTSIPAWEREEAERMSSFQPKEPWLLEAATPVGLKYVVAGWDFKYQYNPESTPAETHFSTSQGKIGVRVDGQVLPQTRESALAISFNRIVKQTGEVSIEATLKSKDKSDTSGTLVIGSDKEPAIRWVLAATVRGSGIMILLSEPNCRLSRIEE